jgi:hypothetical protein
MRKGIKRISAMAVAASMTLSVMVPSAVLAAPGDEITGTLNPVYAERFNTMYDKITASGSGYFSPDGVPYHTIETMNVEAPDYGHVTTSEAFSYYMWLEAMNGREGSRTTFIWTSTSSWIRGWRSPRRTRSDTGWRSGCAVAGPT